MEEILLGCCVILVLLSYIQTQSKKHNWTPPSAVLNKISNVCTAKWTALGKFLGNCGTFAVRIKDALWEYLEDFLPSMFEILLPLFTIIISPLYIFKGYRDQLELFIETRWRKYRPNQKITEEYACYDRDEYGCFNFLLLCFGSAKVFLVLTAVIVYFVFPSFWTQFQLSLFGCEIVTIAATFIIETVQSIFT